MEVFVKNFLISIFYFFRFSISSHFHAIIAASNTVIDDITKYVTMEYKIPTYNILILHLHSYLMKNIASLTC